MYEIVLTPTAVKDLKKLDPQAKRRIQAAIDLLKTNPYPPNSTQLVGSKKHRIRTANYRVMYEVMNKKLVILVLNLGHRKDIYTRIR